MYYGFLNRTQMSKQCELRGVYYSLICAEQTVRKYLNVNGTRVLYKNFFFTYLHWIQPYLWGDTGFKVT